MGYFTQRQGHCNPRDFHKKSFFYYSLTIFVPTETITADPGMCAVELLGTVVVICLDGKTLMITIMNRHSFIGKKQLFFNLTGLSICLCVYTRTEGPAMQASQARHFGFFLAQATLAYSDPNIKK